MKLAYKAVDKQGNTSEDLIEAASTADATEKLRLRGLYVTGITEADESSADSSGPKTRVKGSRQAKAL